MGCGGMSLFVRASCAPTEEDERASNSPVTVNELRISDKDSFMVSIPGGWNSILYAGTNGFEMEVSPAHLDSRELVVAAV